MALTIIYTNPGATDVTTSVLDGNKVVPAGGSLSLTGFNTALDLSVASGRLTRTVNGVSDNVTSDDAPYQFNGVTYKVDPITGGITKIWTGTQATYDALTPSNDTLYIIVEV